MQQFLFYERGFNFLLTLLALVFVLSRSGAAVREFGRKRVARYFGYVGLVFVYAAGNLESILTGTPTGVRTVLGTLILLFVIYSEWPPGPHARES